MFSAGGKRPSTPPSHNSRPSKRTRRLQYVPDNDSEEGSELRASGGSEGHPESDSDAEWQGISRRDLTASSTRAKSQGRFDARSFSSTSDSQAPTYDTSKVLDFVEDGLPKNPADVTSWRPSQLRGLLNWFAEGANGILDAKYADNKAAKCVLAEHPELRDILVTAWVKKEYHRVLTHKILLAKSTFTPQSFGLTEGEKEALRTGLNNPYKGIAVDGLYEYLERNHRYYLDGERDQYYAKFCSIVQSSGTGKTRTMLQLAQRGVLVLYMNLRPALDCFGWPERDDTPASILTGDCTSTEQYSIQCYAFFSAIFKLIRDDLWTRLQTDEGAVAVENWNKDMRLETQPRNKFFNDLQNTYQQIKGEFQLDANKTSEKLKGYYKKLTRVLASAFPGANVHQPKLVIALDEAHTLHENSRFRRSTELFRAIRTYSAPRSPCAVWVVFASTTLKIADFASTQNWCKSARVAVGGELLFPPYCQLGWDQMAPHFHQVPPTEVAQIDHILGYGRPLWASVEQSDREVFNLAKQKLIGKTWYEGSRGQDALVVLAQRFGLDICFGHWEAVHFIESTVASNLRVCVTTNEDCFWSYTTYPSEPILSCVAAILMHQSEGSLAATLQTLQGKVDNGMINMRQCGELVSQLIWSLAKDFLVIQKEKSITEFLNQDETELVHCCMISVIEFLKFLFGDDFWEKVKDAKEAFKDAYVNFSHWISMKSWIQQGNKNSEEQLDLNEWTGRHWQRTCAVQCCHDQPSIDKVIPIYFKSPREGVSQILISDKACISKQADMLSKIHRNDMTISKQEHPLDTLPYIAIVADLCLKETGLKELSFSTWTAEEMTEDALSLRLHVCGLSEKSYPFFKDHPEVLEHLKRLLEWEINPPPLDREIADYLQDQVEYGKSAKVQHMKWEQGSS